MARFARDLLLAGVLSIAVAAQTVRHDGRTVEANRNTVPVAAETVDGVLQLTDTILESLTKRGFGHVSLFQYPDDSNSAYGGNNGSFTGSHWWGNNEHYNKTKCQDLLDHWGNWETHAADPTSVMSPLFQGATCMPEKGQDGSECSLGGFASYSVNVSTVAQVQLAINFARNLNLRLVIQNTGHDFLGKGTGAGALSLWTHNLKSIDFVESYASRSYSGPAMKLGAGVEVFEMYEAADKYGVTTVGGECPGDVFWAIRGGGGGTWGVVMSMTVKAHPKMSFSGLTSSITTGNDSLANYTTEAFWAALDMYWRQFPLYASKGHYGYSSIFHRTDGMPGYTWTFHPWMVPGTSLRDFKALLAPLLADWKTLLLEAWRGHFPVEPVGVANRRTASRLDATLQALRGVVEDGSALIQRRLRAVKRRLDPWDLFWAPTAVGSEGWYVTRQRDWLLTQNGRLCRK
ncbi:putative 6-hydroxy-D-nicotine oxidase [Xylariomycetidae sp. FL0641]|nr:putative 6-hydroxy-D-nicotine oxidase [Xylariomycetidae sp. FL0641]